MTFGKHMGTLEGRLYDVWDVYGDPYGVIWDCLYDVWGVYVDTRGHWGPYIRFGKSIRTVRDHFTNF